MTVLGTAFIEIAPSTASFASKLSSDVKQSVDRAASESASSFDKLAGVGEAAFIAVGTAAVTFGGIAVAAALKGEEATAQLANAITNAGGSFDAVKPQVEALSNQFVKFGFDNVEVEKGLTRLVQITGDTGESMKLMATAANLAAARHIDLETAATLVGKAAEGNVTALKRLGITIDATGTTSEKAAEAIKQLNERFGGAAQAEADTYAGKLKAFHAEVSNLSERIGNALLPVLANLVGDISSGIGFFEKHTEATKALAVVVGGPLVVAMGAFAAVQTKSLALGALQTAQKTGAFFASLGEAIAGATISEIAMGNATQATALKMTVGVGAVGALAAVFALLTLNMKQHEAEAQKWAATFADSISGPATTKVEVLRTKIKELQDQIDSHGVWGHVPFVRLAFDAQTTEDRIAGLKKQLKDAQGASMDTAGAASDLSGSLDDLTQKASGAGSATDKFSAGVNALQSTLINVDKTAQAHRDALRAVGDASDNVSKAQKALSDLQKKGAVDATAVAAAHKSEEDAIRKVADANYNAEQAQTDLNKLLEAGAVDVKAVAAAHKSEEDAIRKVADANYNAEQAQKDLNKLLQDGAVDVKAVATAQRDLERSSDAVAAAQQKLADAQQHFQEVAAGASGEDLGKGQLSLSDAQRTLEKAQLDVLKATDDQQKAYSGLVPTTEDKEKADIALTKAQMDNQDAIDKVAAALVAQQEEHKNTAATADTLAAADHLVKDAQLAARESAVRLTDAQAEYNRVLAGVIPTTEDKKRADLALADAQANVTKATFAVTDATKALDDMRNAGKPGAADYEAAQKAITEASNTLSDALDTQKQSTEKLQTVMAGDPDFAAKVEDAQHKVTEARQGVTDATDAQTKATEDLQTAQMGDPEFAQKIEDAQRKVADARQGVTDATDAQTAAHDALTKAQAGDPDFSQKMADAAKGVRDARNQLGDATQHTADTALAAYDAQTKANKAINDAGPLAGGLKDQLSMISGQYPGLKSISDLVGSLNTQLGQSGFFQYLAAVASAATTPFSITLDTKGLPHFKGVQTAAEGGWVKGPVGAPVPLIAHGGEFVLSREMLANGQAMGGGGVTVAPGAVVLNFAAGTDRATADYARDQFAQVMSEVLDRAAAGAGARHS